MSDTVRNQRYVMTTGAQGCRFTLRDVREEQGYHGRWREYSHYIKTLGKDFEESKAKAQAKADADGIRLEIETSGTLNTDGDHAGKFKFGKYRGQMLADVFAADPDYFKSIANWGTFLLKPAYKKFVAELDALRGTSLAEEITEVEAEEERERLEGIEFEKRRVEQEEAQQARARYLGKIGERETFPIRVTGIPSWTAPSFSGYGEETKYCVLMEDPEGNRLVWFTTAPWDFNVGDEKTVKATVKDHTTREGWKQTIVNRVKEVK